MDAMDYQPDVIDPDGTRLFHLKRWCGILNVDHSGQLKKLRSASWATIVFRPTKGTDGKCYRMLYLTADTFFTWLRTINPRKTRTDAAVRFVYFVQQPETGRIKIGASADPQRRREDLELQVGGELRMLATIEGGYAREEELHERFAHLRLKGEWFRPAEELLAFVSSCTAEL